MTRTKYRMKTDGIPLVTFEFTKDDAEHRLHDLLNGGQLEEMSHKEMDRILDEAEDEPILPGWYHALYCCPITIWVDGPFETEARALADIPRTYGIIVTDEAAPPAKEPGSAFPEW